jgi:peptidoglycan/xylan/chitin deacetylase (PgdA/CDA1 family)
LNPLYHMFSLTGADRLVWKLAADRLRILCYHGVCTDDTAAQPWMPQFFVTRTEFTRQLEYLSRRASVLRLSEAIERLRTGSLPPRAVCITFDDGYANNLHTAYPLLRKWNMPATVFLSTSYIESGEFFPFLQAKLIRSRYGAAVNYKNSSIDTVLDQAAPWWPSTRRSLTEDHMRELRPLTIDEVRSADSDLLEFGGHTDRHCILRNETPERRAAEIRTSIRKLREWTGRPVRLFSYPNGQQEDFSEGDKQVLREQGVEAAVTGIPGTNSRETDPLELRRYPVGLFHTRHGFKAEVAGLRTALRSWAG